MSLCMTPETLHQPINSVEAYVQAKSIKKASFERGRRESERESKTDISRRVREPERERERKSVCLCERERERERERESMSQRERERERLVEYVPVKNNDSSKLT